MTPANKEHFAREAQRLLGDALLATAFESVMMDAMRALTEVDATNTTEILRLQAIAHCLTEVRAQLFAHLAAGGGMDGGVSPHKPTA